ncbi:MAG: hypothetical protein GQ554_08395 [Deltaproteobacteria bacterium]|nr:hypothetical protein [Deltaproteobacteria bacterium]
MYVVEKGLQNSCPSCIESIKEITVAIKNTAITNKRVTNAIKKINNALALNAGNPIQKKPY